MKVRATARGHFRWIRQVGEEFEIPDELHEPTWQEKVDVSVPDQSPDPVAEPASAPVEAADADPVFGGINKGKQK